MAREDVLEDRVAPVRDGAYLDDVAQPLRAVVAGEFSERSFDFFHVGQHMPFDHHLGVRRHHEILAESFRGREPQRRAHDRADLGVIIDAERRDVQRSQIKCRMVADDDRHRRRPVFFFVLAMDLPVVARRHVQAELPRAFHHVALEGDVVKAFVRILHHRRHIDIRRRIHGVMPNYRQVVNICLVAALDDLFDRRLAPRNRYRCKHRVFAARVLEAQRQVAFVGFHAERQRATLAGGEDIAQQRESGRFAVEIERFFKEENGKFLLILEVLEQSGYFEIFR